MSYFSPMIASLVRQCSWMPSARQIMFNFIRNLEPFINHNENIIVFGNKGENGTTYNKTLLSPFFAAVKRKKKGMGPMIL